MKLGKFVLSVVAVLGLVILVGGLNAQAKLGGQISNNCKQAFNFNLIQYPKDEKPGSCGQGNRIFSIETAGHEHLLVTDDAGSNSWDILNCGAQGGTPVIQSAFPGNYQVAVMVNGQMNQAELNIICVELGTLATHDHLGCIVSDLLIKNPDGQDRFQIVTSLIFDASMGDLVWSYEGNSNFKKALFKIYDCS